MSLLAETMEALKFTEDQNKLILSGTLTNAVLAKRFGKCVRQIQRQRAFLKSQAAECLYPQACTTRCECGVKP